MLTNCYSAYKRNALVPGCIVNGGKVSDSVIQDVWWY